MSGVVGRVGRGFGVLAGVVVCVVVAGCSSAGSAGQSVGGQSAHVRMSGDYVLNDDGTLRKPHVMPTAPVIGEEASRFDERGAEAAARHFIDLINYAWASGDTSPLEEFSEDRCAYCKLITEQVRDVYDSGGWAFRIDYKVMQVEGNYPGDTEAPGAEDFEDCYVLSLIVRRNRSDVYMHQRLEHQSQKDTRLYLVVHWDGAGWKVAEGEGRDVDAPQSE